MATTNVVPINQVAVGNIAEEHPLYVEKKRQYILMHDCFKGSDAVKDKGRDYLPMPSGFTAQSDGGNDMYNAYITRAQFPEMTAPTIMGMLGVIHRLEANITGIEGPLAYLWERATADGLTLENLHRKITEELLTYGRIGVLADAPPASENGGNPYLAVYNAMSIVNWSDSGDFFVLEEYVRDRDGFNWKTTRQYRVLEQDDTGYSVGVYAESADTMDTSTHVTVTARGDNPLPTIPFVIGGARDLSIEPDILPLIQIARSALAMYRLDADYRHQLFMSGQETLVIAGVEKGDVPTVVGAGVVIGLPTGGTATYASPTGTGMNAHRLAINDERENAAASGARVMDTTQRGAESGDALRLRARASTATLITVAISSAAILERSLRNCAVMLGQNPDNIVVKPNLDFLDDVLSATDAKALVDMWIARSISYETLYENLTRAAITSQERTSKDEQQLIAKEGYLPDPEDTSDALDSGGGGGA